MSGDYRESLEFLKLLKQRGVTLVIEDALSLMYFKEQFLEFKKLWDNLSMLETKINHVLPFSKLKIIAQITSKGNEHTISMT